eukprot:gene6850-4294_t
MDFPRVNEWQQAAIGWRADHLLEEEWRQAEEPYYRLVISSWVGRDLRHTNPKLYNDWEQSVMDNDQEIRANLILLGKMATPDIHQQGRMQDDFNTTNLLMLKCTIIFPRLNPEQRRSVQNAVYNLKFRYGFPHEKMIKLRSYADTDAQPGVNIIPFKKPWPPSRGGLAVGSHGGTSSSPPPGGPADTRKFTDHTVNGGLSTKPRKRKRKPTIDHASLRDPGSSSDDETVADHAVRRNQDRKKRRQYLTSKQRNGPHVNAGGPSSDTDV